MEIFKEKYESVLFSIKFNNPSQLNLKSFVLQSIWDSGLNNRPFLPADWLRFHIQGD